MNSMAFIRDAKALVSRMGATAAIPDDQVALRVVQEKQIQQELDVLCNNMTNPSLPASANLVEAAKQYGYNVDPKVIHRVNQFA